MTNEATPKKTFTKQQATYLLAHSTDYDKSSVEVEDMVFRLMLGLPPRAEESAPPPHSKIPDWRQDETDGPCPEKEYQEWQAYFHPMAGDDVDVTDILFDREKLEQEAEMSTSTARQRYGKSTPDQVRSF